MTSYLNISAYKFAPLSGLESLQQRYRQRCESLGIRGTILLAPEGINLCVAGEEAGVRRFMEKMQEEAPFEDLSFKESWSAKIPFRRLRVRIKPETIQMRVPGMNPLEAAGGKYIQPLEFKQWLDEGKDIVVLDTRNDYEIKVGTFENALDLQIVNFRDFPQTVAALPEALKKKTVVTFCTGGIRCEKATIAMKAAGFEEVYQIEGGILKYFEECQGAHWQGECFVFDDRIAVKKDLSPTEAHYCLNCLEKMSAEEMAAGPFKYNHYCPHCFNEVQGSHSKTECGLAEAGQNRCSE